jgi:hypothetical protein
MEEVESPKPERSAAQAEPLGHHIELAKSGRASCRSCSKPIAKGERRFGEEMPNPYGDAGSVSYRWHHLLCAAKERPSQLKQALARDEADFPGREEALAALAAWEDQQKAKHKPTGLPYAEHAPNERARCRQCREPIAKGTLRVAVERPLEQRSFGTSNVGYLHAECASAYRHGVPEIAALRAHSTGLAAEELDALERMLRAGPPATTPPSTPPTPPPAD